MLEKFLPSLKPREKQRKTLDGQPYIPDNNLFYNPDSLREEATTAGIVIKVSTGIITFFSSILIVLLVVHTSMNFLLSEALNEQKNILSKMKLYEGIEDAGKKAEAKITYAKKAVAVRKPLTARISFVLSRIPENINLKSFKISSDKFSIVIESSRTPQVTSMIMSWLRDGGISEVSIKEAYYSSSKEIYTVGLEGSYR